MCIYCCLKSLQPHDHSQTSDPGCTTEDYRERWKLFSKVFGRLGKKQGDISFLAPLEDFFGLYRWACPLFELKHKTQPLSFVRTEDYIATAGFSFLFTEKERMYRNFGSQERGNPPYTGTSGTNPASLGNTSTSATHQEQVGVLSLTELGKRLGVK